MGGVVKEEIIYRAKVEEAEFQDRLGRTRRIGLLRDILKGKLVI